MSSVVSPAPRPRGYVPAGVHVLGAIGLGRLRLLAGLSSADAVNGPAASDAMGVGALSIAGGFGCCVAGWAAAGGSAASPSFSSSSASSASGVAASSPAALRLFLHVHGAF